MLGGGVEIVWCFRGDLTTMNEKPGSVRRSRASPSISPLNHLRIHPEHLPAVSIEIREAPTVHVPVILLVRCGRAARGDGLVDHRVHFLATVHAEREQRARLLARIARRPLPESRDPLP